MDLWQFTPLHEAASKNRVEVCSLLLSHGADPTLLNCHSKSAVDMAPTPELKERLTCESTAPARGRKKTKPAPASSQAEVTQTGFVFCPDEFKGHSLLQAAREADMAKVKKTLGLEIISFKHPQTNETALVRNRPLLLLLLLVLLKLSLSAFSLITDCLFDLEIWPQVAINKVQVGYK